MIGFCSTSLSFTNHVTNTNTATLPLALNVATLKVLPPTPPKKRYRRAVATTPMQNAVSIGLSAEKYKTAALAKNTMIKSSIMIVSGSSP